MNVCTHTLRIFHLASSIYTLETDKYERGKNGGICAKDTVGNGIAYFFTLMKIYATCFCSVHFIREFFRLGLYITVHIFVSSDTSCHQWMEARGAC